MNLGNSMGSNGVSIGLFFLTIQGAITGSPGGNWGGIHNTGTIDNVNIANGARVERGIKNNNTMQTLLVSGNVNGGVNNSGTLTMLNLNNGGTINGGINNNRTMGSISVSDSTVNGGINNGNANSTLNNITIETNDNVNGGIHNCSSITNNVTIKGNVTGKVTNAGTITGNVTIRDGGIIDTSSVNDPQNAIDNSGTIQGKISDLYFNGGSVNNHNSGVKVAHLTMLALSLPLQIQIKTPQQSVIKAKSQMVSSITVEL